MLSFKWATLLGRSCPPDAGLELEEALNHGGVLDLFAWLHTLHPDQLEANRHHRSGLALANVPNPNVAGLCWAHEGLGGCAHAPHFSGHSHG